MYKVMVNMKKAGILDSSDIEQLKDVIMFEYVKTCGSVNGRYEVKETLTGQGEHIRYDTDALHLRVNLCGNFFMLRDIAEVYEKIVVHELGHHVYYYKDRLGNADFEALCRS